ncbi:cytochrome b [Pseudomonas syringae]|nr:cytochrome b [Pseudomonas syringae]MCF5069862.1 cytochrome b [Pseudomonas syringae]
MTVSGYSKQHVLLHWVSAAVILWTLMSGFYVATVDVSVQTQQWVACINVSLTTLFIPVFIWRLIVVACHARQMRVAALSSNRLVALFAHRLIYLSVGIVLVTGVLMMNRPINVFGVVEFAQPLRDTRLIAAFFTVHIWACVGLAALVALHVGAVIVHELQGNRVLRRMSWRS